MARAREHVDYIAKVTPGSQLIDPESLERVAMRQHGAEARERREVTNIRRIDARLAQQRAICR
jgi:hypothetical protein